MTWKVNDKRGAILEIRTEASNSPAVSNHFSAYLPISSAYPVLKIERGSSLITPVTHLFFI